MTKTYIARGLLEWQLALKISGAVIRICFSGGSMGSNGVIPAKYVTDNPAIQSIIEKSEYFKNGRIYCLKGKTETDTPKGEASNNPAKDGHENSYL